MMLSGWKLTQMLGDPGCPRHERRSLQVEPGRVPMRTRSAAARRHCSCKPLVGSRLAGELDSLLRICCFVSSGAAPMLQWCWLYLWGHCRTMLERMSRATETQSEQQSGMSMLKKVGTRAVCGLKASHSRTVPSALVDASSRSSGE